MEPVHLLSQFFFLPPHSARMSLDLTKSKTALQVSVTEAFKDNFSTQTNYTVLKVRA